LTRWEDSLGKDNMKREDKGRIWSEDILLYRRQIPAQIVSGSAEVVKCVSSKTRTLDADSKEELSH